VGSLESQQKTEETAKSSTKSASDWHCVIISFGTVISLLPKATNNFDQTF
jgi:hypothetical protein